MSTATSSARYTDLYDYTRAAEQIDHDLIGQADRLANRLAHFEATCREPGFQVSSDGLGPAMRSYGVWALPIDQHVRTVGEAFERADGSPLGQNLPAKSKWWEWLELLEEHLPLKELPIMATGAFLLIKQSKSFGLTSVGVRAPSWLKTINVFGHKVHLKSVLRDTLNLHRNLPTIKPENLIPHIGNQLKAIKHPFGKLFLLEVIIGSAVQFKKDSDAYRGDRYKEWAAHIWNTSVITIISAGSVIATKYALAAVSGKIVAAALGLVKLVVAGGTALVLVKAIIVVVVVIAVALLIGWAFNELQKLILNSDANAEIIDILGDNFREFHHIIQQHVDELVDYFGSGEEPPLACMAV